MKHYVLHLANPAFQWDNASPVGCGSAGLMVWGGIAEERLTFNEESIWDGGPMDTRVDGFTEKIEHIRSLFLAGREYDADCYANENMGNCFNRIKPYEYAGELLVTCHADEKGVKDYRRDIDLTDGVCTVSYQKDGHSYRREYFASYPRKLIVSRFSSDAPVSYGVRFRRENVRNLTVTPMTICALASTATKDNRFLLKTKLVTDGKPSVSDCGIRVEGATTLELYTVIVTSFRAFDLLGTADDRLEAYTSGYDALLAEHIADHSALMDRSDVEFASGGNLEAMPVSERLERLKNDPDARDDGLIALYWTFGKYLLVGSSRPGTLPANLQGVWADGLNPPWSSDYHTNINLQMNYWQAEEANLGECTAALFNYMNAYLLPGGEKVARENYGVRGTVVHHLSDIYGFAAAADGLWGLWPLGGAWLAYHMWEHWLYTGDRDFLRDTAYRYIRKCAEFFMDSLFEGPDGYLHSGPSTSPENRYFDDERRPVFLAISPTMDLEIIGGLLDFYAQTEQILMISPESGRKAAEIRAKMPPLRVGKHGQLMEWLKDYDEPEPGHRHISHAFGLYPAAQITHATPELYRAIEVSLERRLAHGGGHTGWSRAWLINLFARLEKSEEAYKNLRLLFTKSTYPNLFDGHPPFQIDGNFGGAAGIGEMLMQSHEGMISLLPAVPAFLDGSFRGLRARGGYTVSASWKNGEITSLTVTGDKPGTVKIRVPGREVFEVDVTCAGTKVI